MILGALMHNGIGRAALTWCDRRRLASTCDVHFSRSQRLMRRLSDQLILCDVNAARNLM
jgi:hypothetical protein